MAIPIEIQCINKSDRMNPHERILNVGGVGADGKRWKITQAEAIHYIETGQYSFFVTKGEFQVEVVVAVSQYGNKYIKTATDNNEQNNLLSLPECP